MRNSDSWKCAEISNFYHMLWFWDDEGLPTASFRQKLFSLEAGIARFRARLASEGHSDFCPFRSGSGLHPENSANLR